MPTRREFLSRAGAALAAPAAWSIGLSRTAAAARPRRPPNILFCLVDDLGWSDLGCYGNRFIETPNIDRLASQGVRFTDAYAGAPVCSPTRACIMSGQYPARLGITDFIPGHYRPYEDLSVPKNDPHLPLEIETLAEALGAAGYATAHYGKWHLGPETHFPPQQGFEDSVVFRGWTHYAARGRLFPPEDVPEDLYLADYLTDRTIEFIREHHDRPWFVHLSHFGVHIPLEAEPDLVARYEAKAAQGMNGPHPTYAAMVTHIDRSVGRLVAELDRLGLDADTLIVVASDNGGLVRRFDDVGPVVTSNAPLRAEKGTIYEGGIRVPLIVRWYGGGGQGECGVPVTSCDFYPTFLELARAEAPAGQPLDGVSLLPLVRAPGATLEREAIYFHYPHYHHGTPAGAIRFGDWKLIERFEDGNLELYNLRHDIGETRNLVGQYPTFVSRLRQKLARWREGIGARMPTPNPNHDPTRAKEWGVRE